MKTITVSVYLITIKSRVYKAIILKIMMEM